MYDILIIHTSSNGYLGCFHCLAFVSGTALNMCEHALFSLFRLPATAAVPAGNVNAGGPSCPSKLSCKHLSVAGPGFGVMTIRCREFLLPAILSLLPFCFLFGVEISGKAGPTPGQWPLAGSWLSTFTST